MDFNRRYTDFHPGIDKPMQLLSRIDFFETKEASFLQTAPAKRPAKKRLGSRMLGVMAVRQAMVYVESNLIQDLSLAKIAAQVGFSPFHFSRLFKRFVGYPLHQYVIEKRVEVACRLMHEGQLSLKAIATQVGFADQSHFTRHFRRLRGLTPTEYLRRINLLNLSTIIQDN